tara:strand:+ start:2898 stop:3494 length:597 start_codon:yes stop_codon:yes gene_type:complete
MQLPEAGSQLSSVQEFPSLQTVGSPEAHDPDAHWSPTVHAFPSLHGLLLAIFWQAPASVQLSVVHASSSSQSRAVPEQLLPEQVSLMVQLSSSSQLLLLASKTQAPVLELQESSVQGFPSSQMVAEPVQAPPAQVSPVVQALLSLQLFVLFRFPQEPSSLQVSVVHGFSSSQFKAPPVQRPPAHWSLVVQGSPSSHPS